MDFTYVPGVSQKFGITPTMSYQECLQKAYVDHETFYIYLADCMMIDHNLVDFIEKEYEKNKFEYYRKASASSQYNATIMSDTRLEREVLTKRAFSVLLASMEDEVLATRVCNQIINYFPSFKRLKKAFTVNDLSKIEEDYAQMLCNTNRGSEYSYSANLFAAYIVDHYHGLNGNDNRAVRILRSAIIMHILEGEAGTNDAYRRKLKRFNPRDYIKTPAYFRQFKSLFGNVQDIRSMLFILQHEVSEYCDSRRKKEKRFAQQYEFLTNPPDEKESTQLKIAIGLISDALSLSGKSLVTLLDGQSISEEDLSLIMNLVAHLYTYETHHTGRIVDIHASDYINAILVYLIVKAMNSDRDFYYKNSAETQFFETNAALRKNDELRQQLESQQREMDDLQKRIEELSVQNKELKNELLKDDTDAVKPLLAEISSLNRCISVMEKEIQAGCAQKQELDRLREFAFEIQRTEDVELREISLNSLIADKKIYIIGGHINWRNKLAEKYPTLKIVDGHNTSFNEQQLQNADLVLLNVSNMSHALYYKIISVLRGSSVKFDYLGKYSNPQLLEQEIAEAIQKHQQ